MDATTSELEARYQGRLLRGRYRLRDLIGRGGMGAVFRAADEQLGREVAVKLIRTDLEGAGAETLQRHRARFEREARLLAGIQHRNVVTVHDFGCDADPASGAPLDFLVMEYLRGSDLSAWMPRLAGGDAVAALDVLVQAARGVAAGHEAGIVHRDIKPKNLFVLDPRPGRPLEVRVLDFGIAKRVEGDSRHGDLTEPGAFVGTERYASPEQLQRRPYLDARSDVFSLGVIAYELLAGQRPFGDDDLQRMAAGSDVYLRSPRFHNPALPIAVEAAVMRALRHLPGERYADAGALADELEACRDALRTLPRAASPSADWAHAAGDTPDMEATSTLFQPAIAPAPPPPPRREPRPPPKPAFEPRFAAEPRSAPEPEFAPEPSPSRGRRRFDPEPRAALPDEPPSVRPKRPRKAVSPRAVRGMTLAVVALFVVVLGGNVLAAGWEWGGRMIGKVRGGAAEIADALPDAADARAWNDRAREMLDRGRVADALDLFRRAAEAVPENAEYLNNLGYALIRAGSVGEGIRVLEDVVERWPERAVAWRNLADARLVAGDTTAAREAVGRYALLPDADEAWAAAKLRETAPPAAVPSPVVTRVPSADSVVTTTTETIRPIPRAEAPRDSIRLGSRPRPRPAPRRETAEEPVEPAPRPAATYPRTDKPTIRIGGSRPSSGGAVIRDSIRIPSRP